MVSFMDNRKVSNVLYLAITEPDYCMSRHRKQTPPIVFKGESNWPLTLCTCASCAPLTGSVLEKHGHDPAEWLMTGYKE